MGKRRRRQSGPVEPGPVEPGPVEPEAAEAAGGVEATEPVEPEPGSTASRRDFLTGAGNLLVCACGLGALAGSLRLAAPAFSLGPPPRFALGRVADFKMGTLTWLRERDLFVLHDAGGFGAFSARCTHLGCTVQRAADGFHCPCHGARFDPAGRVVAGPARRDLPWYRLWIEPDGRLWIDIEAERGPGTRPRAELQLARGAGG